jgi:hypothetical protein
MRIISGLFLRKYALSYIFSSRICTFNSHIKYRQRLYEAISSPEEFRHIKDYWGQSNDIFNNLFARIPRNSNHERSIRLIRFNLIRFSAVFILRNKAKWIVKKKSNTKEKLKIIAYLRWYDQKWKASNRFLLWPSFSFLRNHFNLSQFSKAHFIFRGLSFSHHIELKFVILDLLDFYLCILTQRTFQKLTKVYVPLEKLFVDYQLYLGLLVFIPFINF